MLGWCRCNTDELMRTFPSDTLAPARVSSVTASHRQFAAGGCYVSSTVTEPFKDYFFMLAISYRTALLFCGWQMVECWSFLKLASPGLGYPGTLCWQHSQGHSLMAQHTGGTAWQPFYCSSFFCTLSFCHFSLNFQWKVLQWLWVTFGNRVLLFV